MKLFLFVLVSASLFFINNPVFGCTNLLVTKAASKDGSTMITYTADSYNLYGELYYFPAARYPKGAMLDIYEWDTGKFLGKIKQVSETYNVVGNMNEYQLVIGETTFGGRDELVNPKGIIDYGSLIYITLQRAKTAREAINVMAELVEEYGYYSSGESFSIADPNEVWILEMVGKGPGVKGANWVAIKIPDGYISGHANTSRITTFAQNDPQNVLYSKDIIEFARSKGYFSGKDAEFSFSEAFNPLNFGAVRFCDARVWSLFRRCNSSMEKYIDYIRGESLERMPLYIKPDKKLSLEDVMSLMRDHYDGTELDMKKGVAAGPYNTPIRFRPLTWEFDGKKYFNERPISTPQTGWSFISQSRSWLPNEVGGLLWFGFDDTKMTVYVPVYSSITKIPYNFKKGLGSLNNFTWDSAFWVFNFVANYVYPKYSLMIDDVLNVQHELEGKFLARQKEVEDKAVTLSKISKRDAIEYLNQYTLEMADLTIIQWKKLGERLIVKYLDGVVKNEFGNPINVGYPEEFKRAMVEAEGEKIKMKKLPPEIEAEANDLLAKANESLKNNNYHLAKTHLTNILKLRPNDETAKTKLEKVEQIIKEINKIHQDKFTESTHK
ncbi:MAG: peptidase U34 dipeptidase [Ignavibacteria bacterium]|nr:MAG: peptidase U34 dipeptidase [Ignavibacteria bacterium]KAF0161442.1 MAG: peptidase U34 dipeptidase [Ignavibacteria bacterium]